MNREENDFATAGDYLRSLVERRTWDGEPRLADVMTDILRKKRVPLATQKKLADWFVDVGVWRVGFNPDGRLAIEGVIDKLWPFGTSPLVLPEEQAKQLPKIDLTVALPRGRSPIRPTASVSPSTRQMPRG